MARKSFTEIISSWPTPERIERAKIITEKLTNLIQDTIQLNETNKIVTYSGVLAGQIPASLAGVAYNNFQRSLHQYEIIRICTFWDKSDENAETIPTVIELIDDEASLVLLADLLRSHHAGMGRSSMIKPNSDPEIQSLIDKSLKTANLEFGNEQADKLLVVLRSTIKDARLIFDSDLLKSVKTLRDRNLAHSLSKTRQEQREQVKIMKYGDEQKLLDETIKIVQNLHLWVNGSSFDIVGDCINNARERSEELWQNCKFDIPTFGKA